MATITLKDVPVSVHKALKARARARGRSLNREIIATLEETLHGSRIDGVAVGSHARAVRESMSVYLTERELKKLKNAGRR